MEVGAFATNAASDQAAEIAMRTADLRIVKIVGALRERLAQGGREPVWDAGTATLTWSSPYAEVARLYLRIDLVDELTHLAIQSAQRCPEPRREAVALSLMALSSRGPLSAWLLSETTGEIELRLVQFGIPQSQAAGDALLSRIGQCEAYVAGHDERLRQILAGGPVPVGPPPQVGALFSAFSK
jgi:hypothetical protein